MVGTCIAMPRFQDVIGYRLYSLWEPAVFLGSILAAKIKEIQSTDWHRDKQSEDID